MAYRVRAKVWKWNGPSAWHFVTVDKKTAARLSAKHAPKKRGFGSIRVRAAIGKTSWLTSIFPDTRTGTYLLPLKASVRRAEGLDEGDTISFTLNIE